MNNKTKTPVKIARATTTEDALVGSIRQDDAFQFRERPIDPAHVRSLVMGIKSGKRASPILLWAECEDGKETGRLILLDGGHRLAALRTVYGEGLQTVTAHVFHGARPEAMLKAAEANSEDKLPLTPRERLDAAWRLVRFHGLELSKTKIARATGIGTSSVGRMRKRAQEMGDSLSEATGNWWRDQKAQGTDWQASEMEKMTDKERQAAIESMTKGFQEVAGKWLRLDQEAVADALDRAFGRKLRAMAEYLYGADDGDFYTAPISSMPTDPQPSAMGF